MDKKKILKKPKPIAPPYKVSMWLHEGKVPVRDKILDGGEEDAKVFRKLKAQHSEECSKSDKIFLVKYLEKKLEAGERIHFDWFHATEGFMYYAHDKLAKKILLKAIETKPLYWFYSEDIDKTILPFLKSFVKENGVELSPQEVLTNKEFREIKSWSGYYLVEVGMEEDEKRVINILAKLENLLKKLEGLK